jgi:hypothetical protein
MSKKQFARTFLLVLVSLFMFAGAATAANLVRLEPVVKPVVNGDSVAIKVYVTNEDNLAAFSLGFRYDFTQGSNTLDITSAKAGPGITPGMLFKKTFKPADNMVLIGAISLDPEVFIEPSTDVLVFTMYMKVPLGTGPTCINIDSAFIPPAGFFVFAPAAGGSVYPDYQDGGLKDINIANGCVDNTPPVVGDIPAQTIAEGGAFAAINLDDYVVDTQSADNLIVWTAASASPNGFTVTIDTLTRIATVGYPGGAFTGDALFTFTATDPGSLTGSDTARFTVTPLPPVAHCKAVIVEAGAECTAPASINDNSTPPTATLEQRPAGPYGKGVTDVWLIVTSNGLKDSCTAQVTVVDVTKPTITCPSPIAKDNDPGQCGAIVNFEVLATDNCPGVAVVSIPPSGSFFPVGTTNVISKATDASGTMDSCIFTVTVNDVEKPGVACPSNIVKDNDPGLCGAIAVFDVNAFNTDNCPGVTAVSNPVSGSVFPVGVTTVWSVATDAHGNKDSCSFTVTVTDVEKPVIACPNDTTIYIPSTETSAIVTFTIGATDNCGVTVEAVPASGSAFPVGTTAVLATATDAHGLTETCTFNVKVEQVAPSDFDLTAAPETLFTNEGIAGAFEYTIDLTPTAEVKGDVTVSVSQLPNGATGAFSANPVAVPGTTKFTGTTSVATPAGTYPITFTGVPVAKKAGQHQYTVYLTVNACVEPPIPVVSQDVFNLTVQQGQNHADQQVYITNAAVCGTLFWNANSDQAWAVPMPDTGSVKAGETPGSLLTIQLPTAGLAAADNYVAQIMVNAAMITINLIVTPLPQNLDSVYVGCGVAGHPGDTVAIPIFFKNDEYLAGMSGGFTWNSSAVTLSYVSWTGSRVEYIAAKFKTINNADKTLALGVLRIPPEDLIAPGSGLWATLYFAIDPSATPGFVQIDTTFIPPGVELLFNDEAAHSIYPAFVPCSFEILEPPPPSEICYSGVIVDNNGNPIDGAVVEFYSTYPTDLPPDSTVVVGPDGAYHVCFPVDLRTQIGFIRAYKPGFYPVVIVPGGEPATIELMPVPGTVVKTNEWVNLYCDSRSLFHDVPVPVGSVIEAFGTGNVLCGQWTVTVPGTYGFMPVYRDDPWTLELDGCLQGDAITLKVNGELAALISGNTLTWTENGEGIEACFKAPAPPEEEEYWLQLKSGWNLVSWGLDIADDDVEALIAPIASHVDVILSFENGGLTYDPALPEFSTLHMTDNFHGYWFRMTDDDSLLLKGKRVAAATPIELEQNWNLVSYLPTALLPVPTALASIWDNVVVVLAYVNPIGGLTYDKAHPELSTLPGMAPYFGFWIKTTAACQLTYPGPVASFANGPADHASAKVAYSPRVNVSNTWVNLYGSKVTLNGSPLAAGSTIEAYSNGSLVGEYTVRENGKFGFMPIYGSDNQSQQITLKVDGQTLEQTIAWTANGDRIQISELTTVDKNGTLPNTFTLTQNYPNPFNPETTIDYAVGKAGHVELSIYNILGAKIKTLVNGYQAQGNYSARWLGDSESGDKVASGVYFYKLVAGDYTDIKKMTLLK